jgi:hypothetical protein
VKDAEFFLIGPMSTALGFPGRHFWRGQGGHGGGAGGLDHQGHGRLVSV